MPSPSLTPEQAERQVEASLGNNFAEGLKTQESKDKAFKSYCEHIAKGTPKYGWFYRDDEGNHCCWETMDKLIDRKVFDTLKLKEAYSKSYKKWFDKGEQLVNGELKGGSPETWKTIMRNKFRKKYGWDEEQELRESAVHRVIIENKVRAADDSSPDSEN